MGKLLAVVSVVAASLLAHANSDKVEILNLVMLFDGKIEEQAKTLVEMSKDGDADIHMISFFLVPEGNPPFDKISVYAEKYNKLREAVGNAECKTGIVLQATLGHGFDLEVPHPYQQLVSTRNSIKRVASNIVCPLDGGFKKYLYDAVAKAAKLNPAVIMVDDDFRLLGGRSACICPLHLARLKEKFGYDITKEEALKHLAGKSPLDRKISDALYQNDAESLFELARIVRAAIDSADPKIPCYMCGSPDDMGHDGEIAKILAAKGQPSTVRVGNARYFTPVARTLWATAAQTAVQKGILGVDKVFAEIDTFPRNRYATSARTLHAGFVVSIAEGCSGAKFWPNRFVDFEPQSGLAYRKIMRENRGMYDELYRTVKGVKYSGIAEIAMLKHSTLRDDEKIMISNRYFWANTTGVMGIPVFFESEDKISSPVFLRGATAEKLSSEELKKILSLGAVVDGDAAMEIQNRGLGQYLGVKVLPWDKSKKISRERFCADGGKIAGNFAEPPESPVHLQPLSDKAEIISEFVHLPYTYGDKKFAETLAPACTYYENSLGGKIAVFASRPEGANHLNESRKNSYLRVFEKIATFGVWYDGDAEVFLKNGTLADGSELVVFVNVGFDPIEPVTLASKKKFKKVEVLGGDGIWRNADFSQSGEKISASIRAELFNPVVLKLFPADK